MRTTPPQFHVDGEPYKTDGAMLRAHLIAKGLLVPAAEVAERPLTVAHVDLGVPIVRLLGTEDWTRTTYAPTHPRAARRA